MLVPVYATAYQYRDKVYHVLINGQTGMIKGEYPKSIFKIALCVLLVILFLLLFFTFFDVQGGTFRWDYLEISLRM